MATLYAGIEQMFEIDVVDMLAYQASVVARQPSSTSAPYQGSIRVIPGGGCLACLARLAAMSTAAARVVGLTKTYGTGEARIVALDDVSLDLESGEFTAVMGPSGSGKSTLMHCCAALDTADSGSVFIGDQDLTLLKDKALTRLRRDQIGFVFQSYNLVPTLTARENIVLPLAIAGRKPDQEWYDAVIATVGLGDRLSHKPNELSGGQQQRVAVARALVSRPRIVFADEPTGNLDSRSGAEVLELLRSSVDEHGQTVVMVTHDPVAASYTDRVVFLADGRIVEEMRNPDREQVLEIMAHMTAATEAV
jgi:putative ABC transport system ATP-binding protein